MKTNLYAICSPAMKHPGAGACAAEPLLLRTRPDGAFSSIIPGAYEQLCVSNDRKTALAIARSRYADFYRAGSRVR